MCTCQASAMHGHACLDNFFMLGGGHEVGLTGIAPTRLWNTCDVPVRSCPVPWWTLFDHVIPQQAVNSLSRIVLCTRTLVAADTQRSSTEQWASLLLAAALYGTQLTARSMRRGGASLCTPHCMLRLEVRDDARDGYSRICQLSNLPAYSS